tara:strand:+ start:51 stop:398 length:348 start_codon:yes stop_codon:yes gene_type:complete
MKLFLAISAVFLSINQVFLIAEEITVNYSVKGMMCEFNCPDFIKQKALKIEGVKECNVDFNKESITVTFDSDKINQTQIETSIENEYKKDLDTELEMNIVDSESTQSFWDWLFGG